MQICGSVRKTHRYLFYRKQVFTVVTGHLPDYMHITHLVLLTLFFLTSAHHV